MHFSTIQLSFILWGYVVGAIPFGVIVSRALGVDIQKVGSGNTGATNVYRSVGPPAGILVFVLDVIKSALPVSLAQLMGLTPLLVMLTGVAAVVGHAFSVFLRFRGGRGSAPALGVLLGVAPDIFVVAFILVAIIIFVTRYVSIASLTVSVLVTLLLFLWGKPPIYGWTAVVITILIWIRHTQNIRRLLTGKENRI